MPTPPLKQPSPFRALLAALMVALVLPVFGGAALAQDARDEDANPYEGSMVSRVRVEGVEQQTEQLVRNNIRTSAGEPLSWDLIREDVRNLDRLGRFSDIQADVEVQADGSVVVVYALEEAPIVEDVLIVGNRQLPDQQIRQVVNDTVRLVPGVPIDEFQIGQAQRAIEDLYRSKGYYLADVTIDRSELEENGYVIFRIREGTRIKVTAIRFDGNESFKPGELRPSINTKTAGLLQPGPLDDEVLDRDVASLIEFYRQRGYLDVRASRKVQPSPDGREAIVTFLIDEGPLYTLRDVKVQRRATDERGDPLPPTVFSREQILGLLEIKPGDVYSTNKLRRSVEAVRDAYLKLGYVDASVNRYELRDPDAPLVDLLLEISEGERYKAGLVVVQGNNLTQQKVVRRLVEIKPDRWLDATAAEETERRIRESRLFEPDAKVTVQPPDPALPGYRDVLVQVEETNTGSLSFGAAIDSDAGLAGVINLNQRNFDIADWPDSFDEFIRGRAFRGAGQQFDLLLQPGTEQSVYSVSLSEPYLFETHYTGTIAAYFRDRIFSDYDEERYGTRLSFGRRFGTRWAGSLSLRAENIELSNIDRGAPVDVFEAAGPDTLTSLGFSLSRTSADSRSRPTKGARTDLSVEQVGALGGDYNFTRLEAAHTVFLTVDEDFFGRKTVLTLEGRVGWIPQDDEPPVFERFYLGGRSFRGFEFRGIGPVGINRNGRETGDHVGGSFLFFLGAQIEKPIWEEIMAVVGFVDSGTINADIGLEEYRVSAGVGLRLYLPQFGNAPLAFDFGFPVFREDSDDTQVFSFSIDLPF